VLVSTLPVVNSDARAGVMIGQPDGDELVSPGWRGTLDPDNFTGFGTWSGTSFAAPIMAGSASKLITGDPNLADVSAAAGTARARAALSTLGFVL
jgi:hypothetical protein